MPPPRAPPPSRRPWPWSSSLCRRCRLPRQRPPPISSLPPHRPASALAKSAFCISFIEHFLSPSIFSINLGSIYSHRNCSLTSLPRTQSSRQRRRAGDREESDRYSDRRSEIRRTDWGVQGWPRRLFLPLSSFFFLPSPSV